SHRRPAMDVTFVAGRLINIVARIRLVVASCASLRTWMVRGGGRGQMAVYYGVVKNNQVVFDDEVHLADGVRVEVRPRVPDERGDSAAVDTQLRAEGLCED